VTSIPADKLERRDGKLLATGVAVSCALHLLLLSFLARTREARDTQPAILEVSLEPILLPQARREQIVSESVPEKQIPNPSARLLAERDNKVEKEAIRRSPNPGAVSVSKSSDAGDESRSAPRPPDPPQRKDPPQRTSERIETQRNKPVPPKEPQTKQPSNRERPKPAETKTLATNRGTETQKAKAEPRALTGVPVLRELKLDEETLAEKFNKADSQPRLPQERVGEVNLASYKAFSRPRGSGAAFLGSAGTSDLLPNLPDGDITLLNTKASKFAVFVRRVASQVFSQLRRSGWETLRASDVNSMRGFSTVTAVLNLKGELEQIILTERSGSEKFDTVLSQAVKTGAVDRNPPPEAVASDGKIRFIFKARSWAQAGSDPRTGAPYERRWLLLQTGLE
jgi:outer membrane biosynthesis protein TonB